MIPAPPPSTPVLNSNGALTTDWYHYLAQDNRPVLNIQDFGARGDGVTDDTNALVQAIGAAKGTGRILLLYPGTYMVQRDLVTIDDAITIVGPRDAVIKNSDADGSTLTISASHVNLYGFSVDGGNDQSTVAAGYVDTHRSIMISGASNVSYITDITIDGIASYNAGYSAIEAFYVTDLSIRNCQFYRAGYVGAGIASCNRVRIENNYITNIYPGAAAGTVGSNCYGAYASRNSGDPICTDVWFVNNYVSDVTWEGLDEHDGQNINFIGNTIYACGNGIAVEHHNSGYPASRINICDNMIYGRGAGAVLEGVNYTSTGGINCRGGVDPDQGTGLRICNNHIENSGDSRATSGNSGGIAVRNFRGGTIFGNYVFFCYKYGIVIFDDGTDDVFYLTCVGNTIDATQLHDGTQSDFFVSERVQCHVVGGFAVGGGDGHNQAGAPTYVTDFVGCRDL